MHKYIIISALFCLSSCSLMGMGTSTDTNTSAGEKLMPKDKPVEFSGTLPSGSKN